VQQQNHFAVLFKGFCTPKTTSDTNRTPYTKSLPLFLVVGAAFALAGFSARSPANLPLLALALRA
jgi:hypothetical protein